jgi:LPS-assembly lipoprotein
MPLRYGILLGVALGWFLLISGCGFALRGTAGNQLPWPFQHLTLISLKGASSFYRHLQQALTLEGIDIDSPAAPITLRLLDQHFNQMATSLGNSGQTTTYLLSFTVTFDVIDSHSNVILKPQSVRITRNFSISTTQLVGDLNTQTLLRHTIEKEAAKQIIMRLRAPLVQQRLQSLRGKA